MTTRERIFTLADDGHGPHVIAALLDLNVSDVVRALAEPSFTPVQVPPSVTLLERDWVFGMPKNVVGLAAGPEYLYFVAHDDTHHIGRIKLDGTGLEPEWLAQEHEAGIAADGSHIYVTLSGRVVRVKLDGTGAEESEPFLVAEGEEIITVAGIAVSGSHVYIGVQLYPAGEGWIARCNTDLTGAESPWTSLTPEQPYQLTTDGDHLFATCKKGEDWRIVRLDVDGTHIVSPLVDGLPGEASLSTRGPRSHLYWASVPSAIGSAQSIGMARCALDGGGVEREWMPDVEAEGIGAQCGDATHIYWSEGNRRALGRATFLPA